MADCSVMGALPGVHSTLIGAAEMTNRGKLILLAPSGADVSRGFRSVEPNPARREGWLAAMQRLRGAVYLADGAIDCRQLTVDGRHRLAIDQHSWHLLSVDECGEVCGCVRYYAHPNTVTFNDLWVRDAAVATSPEWGSHFIRAVDAEIRQARWRNISYVEVGGWAISPSHRNSMQALRTALATYSLAQVLGGCLGIATATVRHHSSSILRRIGGSALATSQGELPAHFDPQYGCEMEVVRFDSEHPADRYAGTVERLCLDILNAPVICAQRRTALWSGVSPVPELVLAS